LPVATVGVVPAAAGNPDAPRRDDEIAGLDAAEATGALLFHGGTTRADDGAYSTAGGRIVTVVGRGPDLAAARAQAETAADLITFDGLQRRHDIGADAVPVGAAP
jgi:phosphoribosylamine--glycine ligase